MSYRKEIDGLRAIAVALVLLYHGNIILFGNDYFAGGFLGVDIFFVISGYLISSLIFKELEKTGRFDFLNFYERRTRRILPALFFVFLISFPFGWFLILPTAFVEFADSIIASIMMVANFFFFFSTTEYAAESSLLKPFLHTWSLSVEEQFYIVFPVVALLLAKCAFSIRWGILILIFFGSLISSELLANSNVEFNFFSPLSRTWELLVGIFAAKLHKFTSAVANKMLGDLFSMFGIFLIFGSILVFDHSRPHPGLITLIPVIGTALFILFVDEKSFSGKIFSFPIFVRVGLASYSIYLWHFPILAFSRLYVTNWTNETALLAIGASIVVGFISLHFVERPFRNKSIISTRKHWCLMVSLGAIIIGSCLIIKIGNGDFARFKTSKNDLINYEIDNQRLIKERNRFVLFWTHRNFSSKRHRIIKYMGGNPKNVLIVGNSHGVDMYNAFFQNIDKFNEYEFLFYSIQVGCFSSKSDGAKEFYSDPKYKEADIILISTKYQRQVKCQKSIFDLIPRFDNQPVSDLVGLPRALSRFKADGKVVVVTGNVVEFPFINNKTIIDHFVLSEKDALSSIRKVRDLKQKVGNILFENRNLTIFKQPNNDIKEINKVIKNIARKFDVTFLDKSEFICDDKKRHCPGFTDDGYKTYVDRYHFSLEGAKYFGEIMAERNWFNFNK